MALGYNLETYRQMFVSYVSGESVRTTSPKWISDTDIIRYINNAINRIQGRYRLVLAREATADMTVNTREVSLPPDHAARAIKSVRIKKDGSDGTHPTLTYLSLADFLSLYDVNKTTPDTGTPTYWTFDPTNYRQIWLGPAPDYTEADSVIFDYFKNPKPLDRLDIDTSKTATFTVNSTTVTLSATVLRHVIGVGDEIGRAEPNQADLTSPSGGDSPRSWYQITDHQVSGGVSVLTLREPFLANDDATDTTVLSAQQYLTGEVSEIEQQYPGFMRFAPAYDAISEYFLVQENIPLHNKYRELAIAEVIGEVRGEPPQRDVAMGHVQRFSWS